MGRCLGCSQENCGRLVNCSCICHNGQPRQYDRESSDDYRARMSEEMMRDVAPTTCKTHPKYTAKRRPHASCEACWRMYIKEQP